MLVRFRSLNIHFRIRPSTSTTSNFYPSSIRPPIHFQSQPSASMSGMTGRKACFGVHPHVALPRVHSIPIPSGTVRSATSVNNLHNANSNINIHHNNNKDYLGNNDNNTNNNNNINNNNNNNSNHNHNNTVVVLPTAASMTDSVINVSDEDNINIDYKVILRHEHKPQDSGSISQLSQLSHILQPSASELSMMQIHMHRSTLSNPSTHSKSNSGSRTITTTATTSTSTTTTATTTTAPASVHNSSSSNSISNAYAIINGKKISHIHGSTTIPPTIPELAQTPHSPSPDSPASPQVVTHSTHPPQAVQSQSPRSSLGPESPKSIKSPKSEEIGNVDVVDDDDDDKENENENENDDNDNDNNNDDIECPEPPNSPSPPSTTVQTPVHIPGTPITEIIMASRQGTVRSSTAAGGGQLRAPDSSYECTPVLSTLMTTASLAGDIDQVNLNLNSLNPLQLQVAPSISENPSVSGARRDYNNINHNHNHNHNSEHDSRNSNNNNNNNSNNNVSNNIKDNENTNGSASQSNNVSPPSKKSDTFQFCDQNMKKICDSENEGAQQKLSLKKINYKFEWRMKGWVVVANVRCLCNFIGI